MEVQVHAQFEDAVTDLCVTSHYLKLHWSIVPCEWDSDFQVGDTIDLSFQVGIVIIIIIIIIVIIIIIIIIANIVTIIICHLCPADVPNWVKPRPGLC